LPQSNVTNRDNVWKLSANQIACRDLLRQLERKGLPEPAVGLAPVPDSHSRLERWCNCPAPARRPPDRLSECRPHGRSAGSSSPGRVLGAAASDIQVSLVQEAEPARWFKGLVGTYHYLGYQQAQGAQVKYLATYRDRPVACLSFGPAAWRVAVRDQFIGWSPHQRQERLPWVVNNDRFLVLPWVDVPIWLPLC